MQWVGEEISEADLYRGCVGITLPEFKLFAAQRGGRGSNGYERDRGAVLHAVAGSSADDVAFGTQSALCGVTPGRRSTGWSCTVNDASSVTCPRCLKRMDARLLP